MEVKISEEMKQSANRNMRNHLRDKNSLTETTECIIYLMARAVATKLEIKSPLQKQRKAKENRRVRNIKKQINSRDSS